MEPLDLPDHATQASGIAPLKGPVSGLQRPRDLTLQLRLLALQSLNPGLQRWFRNLPSAPVGGSGDRAPALALGPVLREPARETVQPLVANLYHRGRDTVQKIPVVGAKENHSVTNRIIRLDGHTLNPGAFSWDPFSALRDLVWGGTRDLSPGRRGPDAARTDMERKIP